MNVLLADPPFQLKEVLAPNATRKSSGPSVLLMPTQKITSRNRRQRKMNL